MSRMTPQRWQRVKEIVDAALDLEPDQRQAFLSDACGGDLSLARQVEGLIKSHEEAGSFIESPAYEGAAELIIDNEPGLAAGVQIGHYRIVSRLGAGGMGEVYLAHDISLDRKVAVKFLPESLVANPTAKDRLLREAKAAAKLDHPNICSIYEIDEQAGVSFIVMQYLEGETLASRLKRHRVDVAESVEIAVQIADALAEAHSRGVIHRDIKPENIMITARGQVKVMDFGLAKIVKDGGHLQSQAETESLLTVPGLIVGTPNYMSPEQVRGERLDGRSDIFALGVVLYETVTGQQPFAAPSMAEVLSAILTRKPAPLARYSAEAPAELERIVDKSLRKNREDRYQSARDMLLDLKSLNEQVEFESKGEPSIAAVSGGVSAPGTGIPDAVLDTARLSPAETNGLAAQKTSAVGSLTDEKGWRKSAMGAVAIVLLSLIGAGLYVFLRSGEHRAVDTVAVLPFTNDTNAPDTEYLSDGITESLINNLSQLPGLRVIARSTAFHFKGQEVDPQKVGHSLGVRAVLTGRVVQRGDVLSIQVDLVNVADGSQLWGEQYNRKLSDLLTVQAEISRGISERLRVKLSGEEQRRVTKRYTDNVEAYQLYLKGLYQSYKRTAEGMEKGIGYFEQAIAADPNYALAYSGLAQSYARLPIALDVPPGEVLQKARSAAAKALEIDGALAEAHVSVAAIKYYLEWDWPGVERECRRAIELDPNNVLAHFWYAHYLSTAGRRSEAIDESKRAVDLDPLSELTSFVLGMSLYHARQYDQAIVALNNGLEVDPNDPFEHGWLGDLYLQKKMYEEAIAELQTALKLQGQPRERADVASQPIYHSMHSARMAHALAVSGKESAARKLLDQLKELSKQKYVPPYSIALIYAGLGERDQALEWLERAYRERDVRLVFLGVDPKWDVLRTDRRFAGLVQRIGLAQ